MPYSYFPGCTLESTAREYDMSTRKVCRALDIEIQEIEDWNCCGATSVTSLSKITAAALPARNLAMAEKKDQDVVTPCNACFHKLKKAAKKLSDDDALRRNVNQVLGEEEGIQYTGKNRIRHVMDVIVNDAGGEITGKVQKPLSQLKVVPYYGCLIAKAPQFMEFEDPDRPMIMDRLLETLGAQVIDFDMKTRCCGGPIVMTQDEIALKLIGDILRRAKELEADCISVPCPMCHFNLDGKQAEAEKLLGEEFDIPVLYFTQMLGLAMGIEPERLGLNRNLVDTRGIVKVLA
ncbi:MAG: CoB--CoM heterodisulfide reductase iron-sulfur subunit B family protein [Candidatus Hydrothermarchaeaceae archaeon]